MRAHARHLPAHGADGSAVRPRPDPRISALAASTERLRARNDQLAIHLSKNDSVAQRVADAPQASLEDATERAKRYWDLLEGRDKS